MTTTKPTMNVDRWTNYTQQRLFPNRVKKIATREWFGEHVPVTAIQGRRMKKKAHKNNDQSLGMM